MNVISRIQRKQPEQIDSSIYPVMTKKRQDDYATMKDGSETDNEDEKRKILTASH